MQLNDGFLVKGTDEGTMKDFADMKATTKDGCALAMKGTRRDGCPSAHYLALTLSADLIGIGRETLHLFTLVPYVLRWPQRRYPPNFQCEKTTCEVTSLSFGTTVE